MKKEGQKKSQTKANADWRGKYVSSWRRVPGTAQNWLRTASELLQNCFRTASELLQNWLRIGSELAQNWLRTASELAADELDKALAGFAQAGALARTGDKTFGVVIML